LRVADACRQRRFAGATLRAAATIAHHMLPARVTRYYRRAAFAPPCLPCQFAAPRFIDAADAAAIYDPPLRFALLILRFRQHFAAADFISLRRFRRYFGIIFRHFRLRQRLPTPIRHYAISAVFDCFRR
jgi:hypothetical protein